MSEKLDKVRHIINLTEEKLELLHKLELQFMFEDQMWSAALEACTKDMDLPSKRRRDIFWLSRNIQIRNSRHPFFKQAVEEIRRLVSVQRSKRS